MSFTHTTKQTLHHTNICVGTRDEVKIDIKKCVSRLTKSVSKVEYLIYEYDKFLTKDAEHIFQTHLHKTGEDEMQIISIFFNSTNIDTQNKILKMLEEPRAHTYFFITIPSLQTILPTIISRAQVFIYKKDIKIQQTTQKFIEGTIANRLEYIKTLTDSIKQEQSNKQDIVDFVEQIEKHFHTNKEMHKIKKILLVKQYLKDPGASIKQLLEYIALTI